MKSIKTMSWFFVVGMLSLGLTLYGQDQQQDQQKDKQQQEQADRPGSETMTGCLTEQQGSYMIATDSGQQIALVGPSTDLSKHKDHTVKITGVKIDDGGKTKLSVTKIEHVSPTCSK